MTVAENRVMIEELRKRVMLTERKGSKTFKPTADKLKMDRLNPKYRSFQFKKEYRELMELVDSTIEMLEPQEK